MDVKDSSWNANEESLLFKSVCYLLYIFELEKIPDTIPVSTNITYNVIDFARILTLKHL